MRLNFKKRIAVFNTLAVAVTTAIVFIVIYAVVYNSSYRHLDSDILLEKEEILNTLDWKGDSIIINKMPEWEEAEHNKVEVNPTFIQIVDNKERMIFKSANLQSNHFLFDPANETENFFNSLVDKQRLRLGQFPIRNDAGKLIGQLTVGISQQESYYVLNNLLISLCISFPILLLVLYLVVYMTASKAIAPVQRLIRAASVIDDSNINTRLPLPENEDELYQLAKTINELLNRIETSVQQQKQFTADASHEIRTPLAAIRGTLEVLLRKRREPEQYEERIQEVINQTDRLNQLIDQLLQLARLESGSIKKEMINIEKLAEETITKYDKQIVEKDIRVKIAIPEGTTVFTDNLFLSMVVDNLVSNALKYGDSNSQITIVWHDKGHLLSITNKGPEISKEQLPFLFDRFYRTDDSRSSHIAGSGLGLAIVKKLADLMQLKITVDSYPGNTTFSLQFPS
ncbi:MAG: HAMP domain-containing histidine kinase [Chitinophagaceae bacterium]|nr:HAMP domain-containing histidine kinase [Chitinophagaceae bacterium]